MLVDTLSLILPTADQTWLLRACLHSGDAGRSAWDAWCRHVGDAKAAFRGLWSPQRRLLPLLYRSVQASGAVVDSALLSQLRAAYVSEELRSATQRRICGDVLAALTAAEVPFVLIGGAMLAGTVYRDPALRHVHDLDILLRQEDIERTSALLIAGGLARRAQRCATLIHDSGLPIELHTRLFRLPFYRAPLADMRARRQTQMVADVRVPTLSSADQLLHVCGQAACGRSGESLQWVCDAWHIVTRYPDLEWDVFLDAAARSRLALPLSVLLGYLARDIELALPTSIVDRLNAAAAQADGAECEAALHAARVGTAGNIRNLLRQSGSRRTQLRIVRWMLFPSPTYLQCAEQLPHPWRLPLWYAARLARYVRRRAWLFVRPADPPGTDHGQAAGR